MSEVADLLTLAEAAERIGMSERELRREVAAGRVTHYRIRSAIRLAATDVQALKEARNPPVRTLPTRVLREHLKLCTLAGMEHGLGDRELALAEKRYRRMSMPPWANAAAIRAIYAEAKRLTAETGVPHHVDHVIPLQGDIVSGLHVETNLRVIPAADNLRKRNTVPSC